MEGKIICKIKKPGAGSSFDKRYVDEGDARTLAAAKDYTDGKLGDYYTKSETDDLTREKSNEAYVGAVHAADQKLGNYYTKSEVDEKLGESGTGEIPTPTDPEWDEALDSIFGPKS